jgi:MarR family transcriptional regulator, organic hydroperoxide resistance regulator
MENKLIKEQAQRIFAAVGVIERSLEKDLITVEMDLTIPQIRTLMAVYINECCTMSELAKFTGYATSALTGIVDRMIKKKLVQRVRDENDRRIVNVVATRSGCILADEYSRKLMRHTSTILEKLNISEREKIVAFVEKIAKSFNGEN